MIRNESISDKFLLPQFSLSGKDEFGNDTFSLTNSYVLVYKSLLMLGSSSTPRKMRKQIAFISVVIMSMLFYYLWEAMLISYFSTPFKFQPFNSLEEFLLKTDKKVSVLSLVPTLCCHIILTISMGCQNRYSFVLSFWSYMLLKAPHTSTHFEMQMMQLGKEYGMNEWNHIWMIQIIQQ